MVVALARQIQAEVAALELIGESTKSVQDGHQRHRRAASRHAGGTVVLFFTGRHHAGEVIDRLLKRRTPAPGRPRLVKVTDGASKNFDHHHREELVEAACNAHYLEPRFIWS